MDLHNPYSNILLLKMLSSLHPRHGLNLKKCKLFRDHCLFPRHFKKFRQGLLLPSI